MTKGQRLDLRLIELGLFPSRQAAQAAIMDGGILVNGQAVTKAGTPVTPQAVIEIAPGWGKAKYVSRGGHKLEKALAEFAVDVSGRVCLDVGASTGGFTHCLLEHGAKRVYAVDVGYGQLDWSLRQDARVVVKERINARNLSPDLIYANNEQRADLAVIDVSFISVAKVLPAVVSSLGGPHFEVLCLIKPQFEAGREQVGKGGVVRSPAVHEQVIAELNTGFEKLGLYAQALTFSPLKGPAGNIEYLVHLRNTEPQSAIDIKAVVATAHAASADLPRD